MICKVRRLRCVKCKRQVGCEYPADCPRYRWYSIRFQGIFAVLDSYRVREGVKEDMACLLQYPVCLETRLSWAATRCYRAEQLMAKENPHLLGQIEVGSVDDWVYGVGGRGFGYVYWEGLSGCPIAADLSEERGFERVRDLVADLPPKVMLSDGAAEIKEALSWLGRRLTHVRCWFHILKDILSRTAKDKQKELLSDLQALLKMNKLGDAEAQLWQVLLPKYKGVIEPLIRAWEQIKTYWLKPDLPKTNNVAEQGNARLWRREKRRNIRSKVRGLDWLSSAIYRVRHRPIQAQSPWNRLTKLPSPSFWVLPLIFSLKHSTDFFI